MQNTSLLERHLAEIQVNNLQLDLDQKPALETLARLEEELNQSDGFNRLKRLIPWFFNSTPKIRGVYLWGGVGRGKTHLMDLFFDCIATSRKKRIHFHRFMQFVHGELKRHQNTRNPLDLIGKEFARQYRLLCLDEFFVLDIGDAVILSGLLNALVSNNVVLVMTSNTYPDDLYSGGIQRDRFVPAIRLINSCLDIVHIADGTDYRLKKLTDNKLYYDANNDATQCDIRAVFEKLNSADLIQRGDIELLGRTVTTIGYTNNSVWFDFFDICDGPRSKTDYIEIANIYRTVVITNVPELNWEYENQARRFIELVDEFYDRGVHLVLSAKQRIDSLYSGKKLTEQYKRTASRLHEMQTDKYLSKIHGG